MVSTYRCTSSKSSSVTICLVVKVVFLLMIFEGKHADAFLSPSVLAAQGRYHADSSSSLKAVQEGSVVPVTDSNYRELFQGEKHLLLDVCAPWCGPCKLIEPLLEQCAEDWKDSLVVGKFDVEDANIRDLKVELILQDAMPQALPALVLVHNGKVLDTWRGVISDIELQEMLEKNVVQSKEAAGITNDNDIKASKVKSILSMFGGERKVLETVDNPKKEKFRPFRGIGLVNNF